MRHCVWLGRVNPSGLVYVFRCRVGGRGTRSENCRRRTLFRALALRSNRCGAQYSRSSNPRKLRAPTNVWRIFINGERLKPYSSSCLARQEKCFRVRSFSTHLEGPEVLIPFALGNFGIGLYPESKLIQVLDRNASISHPLFQMLS